MTPVDTGKLCSTFKKSLRLRGAIFAEMAVGDAEVVGKRCTGGVVRDVVIVVAVGE